MEADSAIIRFCLAELRAAGRRMRHRLQRFPATDIYGDDHRHRTLWDELRFEVENGPTLELEAAWEDALRPMARDVIEHMPAHTQALIGWHLSSLKSNDPEESFDEEEAINAVCDAACELVGESFRVPQ